MFLEQVKIIIHRCFLEECRYAITEKKMHNYIIDDIEISSDSDEETLSEKNQMEKNSDYVENSYREILKKIQTKENSDEENSDEETFDEENLKKKKILI